VPDNRQVSWITKLDQRCFPEELCRRLAARANLIFCNASEREFIEAAFEGHRPKTQIIVETLGSAGVLIDSADGRRVIPTTAIKAHDTTGAGDTLAGEVIAQLCLGNTCMDEAVVRGMNAAKDLLASRSAYPLKDPE
ncbi:MAG: PfkB family carbohydrate kinase, partial [Novosphingobium sp.]